jgi:tetratricopeptide (TPR) repeat protein
MLEEALAMFRSRPGKARPLVDRLLVAEPQNPEGLCLLGQIGVRSKQCAEALEGLPSCPTLRSDFEEASFYLKCLVDSSLYSEARSFESSLDETLRTRRRISRLTAKLPVQAEVPSETDGQIQTTAEPGEKPIPPGEAGDLTPAPSSDSSNEPESPPKEGPSDEDLVLLERIRNSARTATSLSDLDEPAGMAIELADDYPEWQGAQFLAAEIAYRGSDWPQAVRYFKRGGAPNQDQPLLLFYMAIALFETGSIDEARAALAVALPLIDRTEFVNSYVARILE